MVWLAPVAVWILMPGDAQLAHADQAALAILVPLWQEHRVVGQMFEHNDQRLKNTAKLLIPVHAYGTPVVRLTSFCTCVQGIKQVCS
jgi:hypothetical protein